MDSKYFYLITSFNDLFQVKYLFYNIILTTKVSTQSVNRSLYMIIQTKL